MLCVDASMQSSRTLFFALTISSVFPQFLISSVSVAKSFSVGFQMNSFLYRLLLLIDAVSPFTLLIIINIVIGFLFFFVCLFGMVWYGFILGCFVWF